MNSEDQCGILLLLARFFDANGLLEDWSIENHRVVLTAFSTGVYSESLVEIH